MKNEKIDKLKRLMDHVVEQAQRHAFLNALSALSDANAMLLQGFSEVLKGKLQGWGAGTTFKYDDI